MKIETPVREVHPSKALRELKEQVVRESYHLKGPFSFPDEPPAKSSENPIKINLKPKHPEPTPLQVGDPVKVKMYCDMPPIPGRVVELKPNGIVRIQLYNGRFTEPHESTLLIE